MPTLRTDTAIPIQLYSYTYTPPARLQCVNRGSFTFLTATNAVIIHTALVGQGNLKVCIGLWYWLRQETQKYIQTFDEGNLSQNIDFGKRNRILNDKIMTNLEKGP